MWIMALVIMAVVMFLLLRALVKVQAQSPKNRSDVSFYHAQISEIDLQLQQQIISQMDAENAKTEAVRALLKAHPQTDNMHLGQTNLRIAALAVLIFIPAISLPMYAMIGQPQSPDMPLALRPKPDPAKAKLEELIAQIEARLVAAPNDTRGMELIAPLYMRAARFEDAARVLQELNTKLGSSPARETDLGEALMMANDGVISVESHAAFERAVLADAKFNKARYYMGKAASQEGNFDRAHKIWSELAVDMPQGTLKTIVEGDIQKLRVISDKNLTVE